MTLRTRIVAALVFAALIPMAVVIAVPLAQAGKRARDETSRQQTSARTQAQKLLDQQRAAMSAIADRAAEALAANRSALTDVVRGPETVARRAAADLAGRFGLDGVEVLNATGASLAHFDADEKAAKSAALVERRRVATEGESLTLVATREIGATLLANAAAVMSGDTRLSRPDDGSCHEPDVEVRISDEAALCVAVTPADANDLRRDLLKSFTGVAPLAFLMALAVGLVLAGRIARPIRALADRAEAISAQRSHPITLLAETDETRRMTLAFDQMLDALESSERQRLTAERVAAWEEIAKRLAHEIKNPLSPIQLAVENLERTRRLAPASFDEAFAVETKTILEEVGSLRALVDEFAQFARLPRPNVLACDPRAIVDQALALFSGRIEAMHVAVSVDSASAPSTIRADAEQLGRVLKNVIANALDAMEEASVRTLSITLGQVGDRVTFVVRDSGRGFDAESLRRVFTPYFTTRADRGGTGLGMAIARRIAVEHGGSLAAAGQPGRGATITLTLPIAGPAAQGA